MKAIATCVALAMAAPAAAAEPWRSWPSWTFVEAGSVGLRTRLDTTWGGLGVLLDPLRQGRLGANAWASYGTAFTTHADRLARTLAEMGVGIDREKPMRELARPDNGMEIAFLFVVEARAGEAPHHCAYVERADAVALVCGADVPAAALRDDFLAR